MFVLHFCENVSLDCLAGGVIIWKFWERAPLHKSHSLLRNYLKLNHQPRPAGNPKMLTVFPKFYISNIFPWTVFLNLFQLHFSISVKQSPVLVAKSMVLALVDHPVTHAGCWVSMIVWIVVLNRWIFNDFNKGSQISRVTRLYSVPKHMWKSKIPLHTKVTPWKSIDRISPIYICQLRWFEEICGDSQCSNNGRENIYWRWTVLCYDNGNDHTMQCNAMQF